MAISRSVILKINYILQMSGIFVSEKKKHQVRQKIAFKKKKKKKGLCPEYLHNKNFL